jgi:hypothetical protein
MPLNFHGFVQKFDFSCKPRSIGVLRVGVVMVTALGCSPSLLCCCCVAAVRFLMSVRRTKNLKKFILPLTFVVGLASFPLGQFLFHESKKAATSVALIEKKTKRKTVASTSGQPSRGVKSQKRSHKIARNKVKSQKKIAPVTSKPKRERYAH